ncbi:Cytoskeleton-associated protein 2-like Radial fiber and mitotic spindle protein [Channa argus]|uniref:Cytoskeleton-associated protein 2-like Radial fiber and mitotic spindle protein n=1 Tax=Channa argus TaxID=215402 RepID=A0A6G1PYX7_CHAAH|nr:Cytoskeleton-associated protein 2-like Radial fiber and mitotic spindle protein [Channa argus]
MINSGGCRLVGKGSHPKQRKQKLMEYLAAKGKLKLSNPKPSLRDECQVPKPVMSAPKAVKGKENKPLSKRFSTKIQSLAAQSSKHPARNPFGVNNKVRGDILARRQNDSCPAATSGPARPKLNENSMLRSTYTVKSSKSDLNVATKQPNTRGQSFAKTSSNAGCTAIITSNIRWSNSSKPPLSGSVTAASVRMSFGPLVKTKTGLIPAVIQPRNTDSRLSCKSATAVDSIANTTAVANKVVSSHSLLSQRKTPHASVVGSSVNKQTTVSAKIGKVQDQNLKKVLVNHCQPSSKSELLSGLKSTSKSSQCRAAHIKPEGKVGISKPNQSLGPPTDRSTKQTSESGGEKNVQPCRVAPQTSLRPTGRFMSRAVTGGERGAVAELGGKTMKKKDTQIKKGRSSANILPQKPSVKKTGVAVISKTVQQPARTTSFTGQAQDMKTPKVTVRVIPQTEGRKMSAAQEERLRKLQEWREAKGISYKRPPMPVRPQVKLSTAVPQPFWSTMKDEDDAHSLICAVDRSLADCIKLLEEGCPSEQVKEVVARLPAVSQKFAKYWICQARLMEQEGNLDVLPMFEEAVRVVLEPVDELRNVVFEILKKKDEIQEIEKEEHDMTADNGTPESSSNPAMTPKTVRVLICGERGDSSVVKYKITGTPGGPPSQRREPIHVNGQEVRFFTPVRRSVRIERASLQYPASLQDHDLCVVSYSDLISKEQKEKTQEQEVGETSQSADDTPMYIYRQNEALKDKVQLFCKEDV